MHICRNYEEAVQDLLPKHSTTKVTLHDVAYWFGEWECKKDEAILHKFIVPMENALVLLPKIVVRDSAVDALCHGANLTAPGVCQVESGIAKRFYFSDFHVEGRSGGVGKSVGSSEEIMDLKHGAVACLERVLMLRGTYPKVWKSGKRT